MLRGSNNSNNLTLWWVISTTNLNGVVFDVEMTGCSANVSAVQEAILFIEANHSSFI